MSPMTMDIHGHPSALMPPEIRAIPEKPDNRATRAIKAIKAIRVTPEMPAHRDRTARTEQTVPAAQAALTVKTGKTVRTASESPKRRSMQTASLFSPIPTARQSTSARLSVRTVRTV